MRKRRSPGPAKKRVEGVLPPSRGDWRLALAAAAALGVLVGLRFAAPQPWDYDEYFHLALGGQVAGEGFPTSLPWMSFSTSSQSYADKEPLFHLLLAPLAGMPLERASFLGALVGQALVVGALAWLVWRLRPPHGWLAILALAGMGTLFAQRLGMCRPHHGEIGFSLVFLGLLIFRTRLWVICGVAAVFGLFHTSGWLCIVYAGTWAVLHAWPWSSWTAWSPTLRPLAAATMGWVAGQLLHPSFPANWRLLYVVNWLIPREAAAGDVMLRSHIGAELRPPDGMLLVDQWPALVAAGLLATVLLRKGREITRPDLLVGLFAFAFLGAGVFAWRRFFELAPALTLLALATIYRERAGSGGSALRRGTLAALTIVVTIAIAFTGVRVRQLGIGQHSPPRAMAEWLGEHGSPGEGVFTAQWADSAPLFYAAPQLRTMVELDPTFFWLHDRELFSLYTRIVYGRHRDPLRAIRERFGARWVTVWKVPALRPLTAQLIASGARIAHSDASYLVLDLGGSTGGQAP